MNKKNRRFFAALLSSVMCFSMLVGCGGGTNSGNSSAQADAIVYLSTDNEFNLISEKKENAEAISLKEKIWFDGNVGKIKINANPTLDGQTSMVMFSADGKGIYFYKVTGSTNCALYYASISALKDGDASAVQLISENVDPRLVKESKDGLVYLEGTSLYAVSGETPILLASDVNDYNLTADKKGIFFSRANGNGYDLYCCPINGNTTESNICSGVDGYYYGDSMIIYHKAVDGVLSTVYCAEYGKEAEIITESCYIRPASVSGDTCYYLEVKEGQNAAGQPARVFAIYYFDGKDSELVTESLNFSGSGYFNAEQKVVIIQAIPNADFSMVMAEKTGNPSYGQFACYLDNQLKGCFALDMRMFRNYRYVGISGQSVILYSLDNELIAYQLTADGTELPTVLCACTGAPQYSTADGSVYYIELENRKNVNDGTLFKYSNGETTMLAEHINYAATHIYENDIVLTISSSDVLTMIEDGEENAIAENIGYYLRTTDGNILLISNDNILFEYSKGGQIRITDGAAQVYCGSPDYGITFQSETLPMLVETIMP